jgi:GSCFA family
VTPAHRSTVSPRIDGARAWENVTAASARWTAKPQSGGYAASACARISGGLVLPEVEPKFRLDEAAGFFCIGSCFARNIEEQLLYRGLHVPSKAIAARATEWISRPNGFVNKFTTASILNELRWALDGAVFPESSIVEDRGGWRDLQLAAGLAPVELQRARELRAGVTAYFRQIAQAGTVIITLGLVETWYDALAEVALNAAPLPWTIRRWPERFSLAVTGYAENVALLHEIVALLKRYGRPAVRIVLTVSPVPMDETFSGEDVVTANQYSKSTLRAAASDVARAYDDVQYFPSFEAVVTSQRAAAYSEIDQLHVKNGAVDAVTAHFLAVYGIERPLEHPEFNELEYIFANPDVREAIIEGRIGSGFEHWRDSGRHTGRPLRLTTGRPWFLELS